MKNIIPIIFLFLSIQMLAQNFTSTEKNLIHKGDINQKMNIYLTSNQTEKTILKNNCDEINPKDPDTKILANRMLLSMTDPENLGVGIAAPQVGINRKMIWVQRFDKKNYPYELFLNIKITWRSELLQKGTEGCLSIPDERGDVIRNYAIEIEYQTLEGKTKKEIVEDFTAVIFQHEIDHLEGILFPDRISEQNKQNYESKNQEKEFSILSKTKN